jgi:hypothetical protein
VNKSDRPNLAKLEERRIKVQGTFVRYGKKTGWTGKEETTVLLSNITGDSGNVLTDHLWLNLTKGIAALGTLQAGDVIEFEARVKGYLKGYFGHNWERQVDNPIRESHKLSHPTRFRKLVSNDDPQQPA